MKKLFALATGLLMSLSAMAANPVVEMKTNQGVILIELDAEKAPKTVANFLQYVKDGFYNGTVFHRVIDGFMAQTGDPTGTGTGGSDLPDLPAEFSNEPYKRGTVGAARTQNPNSANSQFFICFNDSGCAGLRGQYTVWGQVVSGMEFVDKLKRGTDGSGMVDSPDVMVKVTVQ